MNDLELEYQDLIIGFADETKISDFKSRLQNIQTNAVPHMVKETLLNWYKKIKPEVGGSVSDHHILSMFPDNRLAAFQLWIFAQTLMDYQDIKQLTSERVSPYDLFATSKHLRVGIACNCPQVVLFYLNLLAHELHGLKSDEHEKLEQLERHLSQITTAYAKSGQDCLNAVDYLILALVEVQLIKLNTLQGASPDKYLPHVANARSYLFFAKEHKEDDNVKISSVSLNPAADSMPSMLAEYKFQDFDFDRLFEYLDEMNDISTLRESPVMVEREPSYRL